MGPRTHFSDNLHGQKYRSIGEDFRESQNRVAFGLKDDDPHYHQIREICLDMRFLFGGRIQGSIGASRRTTAFNCYVSGTIDDALVGPGSIMARLHEAAATLKLGGGIGYDFSTLRPRGTPVKTIQTNASGPVSFMDFFNTVGLGVCSTGHRFGAQMGILRIDHPDVEEFILAKQNNNKLNGFNVSLAITDEFMEAVISDKPFNLVFHGEIYKTVDATALWERVMRSTWDFAEPGVVFIDTMNKMNNLWYCEKIAATNPCSEQPLPPFGACLLGSFNLPRYLITQIPADSVGLVSYSFDWDQFEADIPVIVRATDNVIDRTIYPLAEQRAESFSKRRMGLGVTGLANAAEALGYSYGSPQFVTFEEKVLEKLRDASYMASSQIAGQKGSFPLFDPERYLSGPFINALPEEVRYSIKKRGIRNSHLTSIAPTGTISLCADNVSSSIEPVFAYETKRKIKSSEGDKEVLVLDYGKQFLGTQGKLTRDVTADEHLEVLKTAQKYIDSAVSKTINMDGRAMMWPTFKDIYRTAWEQGCKGCTTYNISGMRSALLKDASRSDTSLANVEQKELSCSVDSETGRRECA